jgi:hypothetical protein
MNNSIYGWPINSPPHDPDARSIFGDGAQTVGPPDNGVNALNAYCGVGGWTFDKNVMARTYAAQVNPPNSFYLQTIAGIGFQDIDNDNCRLGASSPYKGICADGSDPGCDLDVIQFATQGVRHT